MTKTLLVLGSLLLPAVALGAPAVTISNPRASAPVDGWLPLDAEVLPGGAKIHSVRFSVDGVVIATQIGPNQRPTHPEWSFYAQLWDSRTVSNGAHVARVDATDATGAVTTVGVGFTVLNLQRPCIPPGQSGGDWAAIQAALSGPNAHAVLCPYATYYLSQRLGIDSPGQEIYTAYFPTDGARARLVLNSSTDMTAVDGSYQAYASLRNLQVIGPDGGSAPLGGYQALVFWGGPSHDQFVDSVRILDTHSWSSIQFFENECKNAVMTRNQVGPAGYNYFPGVGDAWADGISWACRDSVVTDNVVLDATDGGIVVFDAPGTLVARNSVTSYTRIELGGINLLDPMPAFDADFAGTRVESNVVDARWGIKAAMAVGVNTWGCDDFPVTDDADIVKNGVVLDNLLRGPNLGYGIPVNGARSWIFAGNSSTASHGGTPAVCGTHTPATPAAFQIYSPNTTGITVNPGTIEGRVEYAPGLTLTTATSERILWPTVPVTTAGAAASEAYFDFYVPPATTRATVRISGGSGDADLYVRRDDIPTTSAWDCRPYTSTSTETCAFTNPIEGHYYVTVRGYTPFSGVSLVSSTDTLLTAGATLPGIRGLTSGTARLNQVYVPAGTHTVAVTTWYGSGDADLYVARSGTAGPTHYDCRSTGGTTSESCSLSVIGPAYVSIALTAYTDYAGVSLLATVSP